MRSVNYIPDVSQQQQQLQQDAGSAAAARRAYSRTASTSSEHHVQTTTLTPGVVVQRVTFTSIGDARDAAAAAAQAAAPAPVDAAGLASGLALAGIGGRREREPAVSKPSTYQRILSSLTGSSASHSVGHAMGSELAKSATTSFIGGAAFEDRDLERHGGMMSGLESRLERGPDRVISTSISSIGGAVLRSKTADIERMLRISRMAGAGAGGGVGSGTADDKKKYTKRRYTRHIPDADSLTSSSVTTASRSASHGGGALPQTGAAGLGAAAAAALGLGAPRGSTTQGPVWKRRELIASDPKRHDAI